MEEAARAAARVIPVFERCGDDLGLCRARRLEAWLHWNEARAEAAAEAWERAAAHARLAGDRHEYDEILTWIASSLWFGPTPADEGIRRCEAMREEVRESPESEAAILRHLAGLHAMVGRFDLARRAARDEQRRLRGPRPDAQRGDLPERGRRRAARRKPGCGRGEPARGISRARGDGRARVPLDDRGVPRAGDCSSRDATRRPRTSPSSAPGWRPSGDLLTQVLWRGVRARVLARRGGDRGGGGARARGGGDRRSDRLRQLPGGRAAGPVARARGLPAERDEAVAAASEALRSLRAEGKRRRRGRDSGASRRTRENVRS